MLLPVQVLGPEAEYGRRRGRLVTQVTTTTKSIFEVGDRPPLGVVPERMYAQLIRQGRYGEPAAAFMPEVVDVPSIGPAEVLIYVMAAGINYNNVWASLGKPV